MTPSSSLIIHKCPHCHGSVSRRFSTHCNNPRFRSRSDGALIATNSPGISPLVACPHCDKPFSLLQSGEIAEFSAQISGISNTVGISPEEIAYRTEQQKLRQQYASVPEYAKLTPEQCVSYIEKNNPGIKEEEELRMYAMHFMNDLRCPIPSSTRSRLRDKEKAQVKEQDVEFRPMTVPEERNLIALLKLLDSWSEDGVLLSSEILRELGCFSDSINMLDHNFTKGAEAEQIISKAEMGDQTPFFFVQYEDADEFEYRWKARRYEPEGVPVSSVELDPPIFHIRNRNWYVKILGMLSHNWALIEQNQDGSSIIYFFQDKSPKHRPAVIDSLDFQNKTEAMTALEINGFELLESLTGPWMGQEPAGFFYDVRTPGKGIYSGGEYWK